MSWINFLVMNTILYSGAVIFWLMTKPSIQTSKFMLHVQELLDSAKSPSFWMVFSFLQWLISTYIFSEWGFAVGFFIAFVMDTFSGIYIAWREKRYSGKILRDKLMDKSVAYFTIIIAYSATTKIVLQGSDTNVIQYIDLPFYSIFAGAEVASIIKKWYEYKKWPVLAKLMTHFQGFNNETGKKDEHADADQDEPNG